MFEKIANIFRIPDLRKRVLFTLGMLAVYRLGGHIPTPGINADMLAQFFNQNSGSALGLVDLFSGGNLRKLTVFALGIMPYITASIIFQLLTVIYEPLAKLQKEGELGRRKITQWTRYVTVLLGIVQSFAIALTLTNTSTGQSMVTISRSVFIPLCVITLTAGTAFIMWLGEQITERGIGNGMSLLIFAGIVVGLPKGVENLYEKVRDSAWGSLTPIAVIILIVGMIAVVAFIVYVERSERRIPVQYAKRIVGRKMMGGQSTFLPLKVNSGGVMPVIFASSILSAPLLFSGAQHLRLLLAGFGLLRSDLPCYRSRRALVRGPPDHRHYFLRILLYLHRLPSRRHRRQHAQVWRLHPRYPPRQAHRRLHQRCSHPHHARSARSTSSSSRSFRPCSSAESISTISGS